MKSSINIYKKKLFQHLDGIVFVPTIIGLNKSGILNLMLKKKSFSIENILYDKKINPGYLNISLRTLRTLNFLHFECKKNELKNIYHINNNFIKISNYIKNNVSINKILHYHINYINLSALDLDNYLTEIENINLSNLKENLSEKNYNLFEGIAIGPLLANISFYMHLHILDNKIKINSSSKIFNKEIIKIFKKINFLNNRKITTKGKYFFKKSSSYGVTVSYLNTFNNLDKMLTTNPNFIWERSKNNHEIHLNRSMNVWGSGGSHKSYFKKIDKIIINVFNQDINLQPIGIIDIGCGDGTFLKHVNEIIMTKTIRKKYTKEYPLILIGTDINKKARMASRRTLNNTNAIIIYGNISEPSKINEYLNKNYNYKLNNFINCRTFLDHNRIFKQPKKNINHNISSNGSFCFKGNLIQSKHLITNFIDHMKSWKPYIKKYGLIIIELHTLNPEVSKSNRGNTLCCAYDATHGYSDQYLIEYKVFKECLNYLDIKITKNNEYLYPQNMPTVSINYIK